MAGDVNRLLAKNLHPLSTILFFYLLHSLLSFQPEEEACNLQDTRWASTHGFPPLSGHGSHFLSGSFCFVTLSLPPLHGIAVLRRC